MLEEPWIAHEAPDRPFDTWMWLDDCAVCLDALKREAVDRPGLLFCLKTSADRVWVTAELLCETRERGKSSKAFVTSRGIGCGRSMSSTGCCRPRSTGGPSPSWRRPGASPPR